ncbi:D-amino-acid transaminase [Barrientosiimonas marina]|uniref:D-alanine aminotransferase n=1 Tax=Lentibacillus kimchii TaxID=1542911 RepID=A0ABW2UUZ9_9BACI
MQMLYNGKLMERAPVIDIEDRGYQFGDGVYEVIGVYDGEPLMMAEHMERLQRSARELRLSLPKDMNDLRSDLEQLVKANALQEGIIYLQVSRGIASRDHEFPSSLVPPVIVAYTREEKRPTALEDQGGTAILMDDIRWLRCDIKTLNLLPNVLAKQKAVENHAVEAILHRGDTVTEASASNVFIVKKGHLYTHPADQYILNGITRRKIIELCETLSIKVHEEAFTVSDLLEADEVFISATKLDIIPILQVGDNMIYDGQPGSVTKQILQAFRLLYQHD